MADAGARRVASPVHAAAQFAEHASHWLVSPDNAGLLAGHPGPPVQVRVPPEPHPFVPWLSLAVAVWVAAFDLARAHLPRWLVRFSRIADPLFSAVNRVHTGRDYVMWMVIGLAVLSGAAAFAS